MMEKGERGEGNDEKEWKRGRRGWERGWKWMGEVEMVEMGGKEGGISGNG